MGAHLTLCENRASAEAQHLARLKASVFQSSKSVCANFDLLGNARGMLTFEAESASAALKVRTPEKKSAALELAVLFEIGGRSRGRQRSVPRENQPFACHDCGTYPAIQQKIDSSELS